MKIDWPQLILNLRNAGITTDSLGPRFGTYKRYFHLMANGKITRDPPFSLGLALLDLHFDTCPEKHGRLAIK